MSNQTTYAPLVAHERALKDIFSDQYAFEIPVYQRPYAWEQEQARDLLNDLFEAMDSDNQDSYFLGSLVLVKQPQKPLAEVIDGQQRLTTLTIMISVLRDMTTDPDTMRDRRGYVYQKGRPDEGIVDKYRLLTRRKDRDFFRKHIQAEGATSALPSTPFTGSQQRFIENARYFRGQFTEMVEARRSDLMRFLMTRCYLVSVEVPDADSARRIFVVLNSRGLDLSATDILKAKLLSKSEDDREDELAERWEAIESQLGRDQFTELFGHIRMIDERDKPRMSLERAFPMVVPSFSNDPDFIGNVLEPAADRYSLVSNVAKVRERFGPKAADAIAALLRIDNKDWIPAALCKLENADDDAEIAQFLMDLERLAYQLFVTRADINARLGRYVGVLNEIDPRPDKEKRDTARRDKFASSEGIALSEDEKVRFLEALDGDIYLKTRVCKPLLERLDALLSAGEASYGSLSIEHVLPQTVDPTSEWARLFPNVEDRETWTHRLANLVLLTSRINTRASNWDFERKKREYFQSADGTSPFPVTQAVLKSPAWDVPHLEERQDRYLSRLSEHWDLGYVPGPKVSGA